MKIAYLGCGDFPMEGAINVDIRDLPGVDVVSDVRKLPFKKGELDGIASRNLVEHFGRHEVGAMVKEWARCLKKGGFLQTETVDVGFLMDKWRAIPEENWLDGILGAQTYDENFHKMAFTREILERLYYESGLEVVQVEQFDYRQIPRIKIIGVKK